MPIALPTTYPVGDLSFVLTAEAVVAAGLGLMLRTPQIEVASVLLIGAAHVCYHLFLWMPLPGFEEQAHFVVFTVLLACICDVATMVMPRSGSPSTAERKTESATR